MTEPSSALAPSSRLVVVSRISPDSIEKDADGKPIINSQDQAADALDAFNHPRYRRALILQTLEALYSDKVSFLTPSEPYSDLDAYYSTHSSGLVEFLSTAWDRWEQLGDEGRDPSASMLAVDSSGTTPSLIPICVPLGRDPVQRPSQHVMGQIGYYCTDSCTPVCSSLQNEIQWDAAIVDAAVHHAIGGAPAAYAIPTHPGHHSARDSFGGYCYLNHAARAAKMLQEKLNGAKVAVLDVDYHCGNGTASIFYEDPTVLVVSIHCDPDWDYPFHSGFADETGTGDAVGATLHLPLPPGTDWESYKVALQTGLDRIREFGAQALVVSLGLDTHADDPCTIRRAGFSLSGEDYWDMGKTIGASVRGLPTVFMQEGGYRMEVIGKVASDVVVGFCSDD